MNYDDSLKWRKYHDMRKVYKQCAWQGRHTSKRRVFHAVVKQPFPCYYISAEYCVKMFRWLETGSKQLDTMLPPTRKKLDHLYALFLEAREQEPDTPKIDICYRLVNSEAPELFMTGDSAYNFFLDMQKKERLINKLRGKTP